MAGAPPDERELALAYQLDLVVARARSVEPAVPSTAAAGLAHRILDVAIAAIPGCAAVPSCRSSGSSSVFTQPPLADPVPARVALRDDV